MRDPSDFSSHDMTGTPAATDQVLGIGDGIRASFPLVKRYGSGVDAQVRRVTRPVAASLLVKVGSTLLTTGWTLGADGAVTFTTPPPSGAEVRAGFLFDVPVRFADDHLQISGHAFAAGEAPSVPVIEIREAA